jgi:hypothetical protein
VYKIKLAQQAEKRTNPANDSCVLVDRRQRPAVHHLRALAIEASDGGLLPVLDEVVQPNVSDCCGISHSAKGGERELTIRQRANELLRLLAPLLFDEAGIHPINVVAGYWTETLEQGQEEGGGPFGRNALRIVVVLGFHSSM